MPLHWQVHTWIRKNEKEDVTKYLCVNPNGHKFCVNYVFFNRNIPRKKVSGQENVLYCLGNCDYSTKSKKEVNFQCHL